MSRPDVLCIGAVHWDTIGRTAAPITRGADLPGRITRQPGGVAFNIALGLRRAGMVPALLSAVGEAPEGTALGQACDERGLLTAYLHRAATLATDRYLAIEGPDGLFGAVADTAALEIAGESVIAPLADGRLGTASCPWEGPVALDANLPAPLLAELGAGPLLAAADLRLVAASPDKATRLAPFLHRRAVMLYLNLAEAGALAGTAFASAPEAARALIAQGAARVLITDGSGEVAEADPARCLVRRPPQGQAAGVTGAGDSLMAAHIAAEMQGADRAAALDAAVAAAAAHTGVTA